MWNHQLKIGLASVGYQLNLSNALAGFQASRKAEMSMFLGPSVIIPISDKSTLSPDERVMAGHQVELVEPFTQGGMAVGAHLGVKLRIAVSPRIGVFAEPTLYLLGNTKLPSVEFLTVKYMQTVNVGVQYEL